MTKIDKPLISETPSEYADRIGLLYTSTVSSNHKKELGQFFTPLAISRFMAEFSSLKIDKVKILDPGCGVGILSCALVERLLNESPWLKEIYLAAFESDDELLPFTDHCLDYLSAWSRKRNIKFTYFLCKNDFILHNSTALQNDVLPTETYDLVIANPPYFKIRKDDSRALAAKSVIYGQTNIYSIFLMIAANLLSAGGQLIFITPRSFTSGSYFRLFREKFFDIIAITHIHLFGSRKEAFERDKVLQENIIVVGRKKSQPSEQLLLSFENHLPTLKISSSRGTADLKDSMSNEYRFEDLVNLQSDQKIFHIPASTMDNQVISVFKSWNGSLHKFGMEISTGPVVDFRSLEFIRNKKERNTVPLIYLHNIDKMKFTWPDAIVKGKDKGHYIVADKKSNSQLVDNKDYVLLRRFSAKDDRSRLVASPYLSSWLPKYHLLGIENHLNYIYKPDGTLKKAEVYGLAAILNSKLFDVYFRTFNGNINVSATELRNMPLPSLEDIRDIGETIVNRENHNQEFLDLLIQEKFQVDLTKANG